MIDWTACDPIQRKATLLTAEELRRACGYIAYVALAGAAGLIGLAALNSAFVWGMR